MKYCAVNKTYAIVMKSSTKTQKDFLKRSKSVGFLSLLGIGFDLGIKTTDIRLLFSTYCALL